MMRKSFSTLMIMIMLLAVSAPAFAADFFDTSKPKKWIGVGVRAGINRTGMKWSATGLPDPVLNKDCTGFDLGAVVNLNIRNYFTIQPGFFIQNSGHDAYFPTPVVLDMETAVSRVHARHTAIEIPIMFQFNFNLAKSVRWSVALGPVLGKGLGGNNTMYCSDRTTFKQNYYSKDENNFFGMKGSTFKFDFGTNFTFAKHFVLGIHYRFGCSNEFSPKESNYLKIKSHSKSFSVSVGYDF